MSDKPTAEALVAEPMDLDADAARSAAAADLAKRFESLEDDGSLPARLRRHKPEKKVVLSQPEKAAVIISVLGPEASGAILRELTENEVRLFARSSAMLEEIPRETLEETITEFINAMNRGALALSNRKLKNLLAGIMSEDAIERILEDMDEAGGRSIWERLSQTEGNELSSFLSREHPQTAAVVLSRIKPEKAAKALGRFEPEFADEVVHRMGKISQLKPGVLDAVKKAIEGELLYNAGQGGSKRRPDELIGSILNFMPNDNRDRLLSGLESRAPQLATAVQRKMFTFADIRARVERTSVATVMRAIDNATLITALAGASEADPETVEFFLTSVSKRMAEQIRDELVALGEPSLQEAEEAQFEVVATIRRLSDTGQIRLNKIESSDDDY